MLEDFRGAVHLSQDDDHLVVYELLELPQVADHLHLQLGSDLGEGGRGEGRGGNSSGTKRHTLFQFVSVGASPPCR